MERLREEEHHPDCCCQFNPTSYKIEENVLASECCPVHNYNPIDCQACIKCKYIDDGKLI